MEASTLRWILVVLGVLVLAAVFVFGNPDRQPNARRRRSGRRSGPRSGASRGSGRKARRSRDGRAERSDAAGAERREPTLAEEAASSRFADQDPPLEPAGADGQAGGQQELAIDGGAPDEDPSAGGSEAKAAPSPPPPAEPLPGPLPEKTVTLYLQARDNHLIAGDELLSVTLKSGMVFGAMNIFHRMTPGDERPVFSLANLTKPGWFDKEAWNTLETRGLTLFMGLPGPLGALDAWDSMLATARRIAELLHLDLLDSNREIFTREREGQIREELRAFERSQRPEG